MTQGNENISFEGALSDNWDKIESMTEDEDFEIRQEIELTYGNTTVLVDLIRDSEGNVIDTVKYFQNLPSLDWKGNIIYDEELSILENILSNSNNWKELDQRIFDTDSGESLNIELEADFGNFSDEFIELAGEYPITIKVGNSTYNL